MKVECELTQKEIYHFWIVCQLDIVDLIQCFAQGFWNLFRPIRSNVQKHQIRTLHYSKPPKKNPRAVFYVTIWPRFHKCHNYPITNLRRLGREAGYDINLEDLK